MFSTNQRKIASNTIVQFIARLISSGSTFVISIYLAKSLGIEVFGDFSKVTTYIPLFYLLVDLGLNASFLRINNEDKEITWQQLFGLRLIISFGAIVLSLLLILLLPTGLKQGYTPMVRFGIILYSLSILLTSIITTSNALFQKLLSYKFSAIALIVGSVVSLTALFIFPITLINSLLILLLGLFITAFLSILFVSRLTNPFPTINVASFIKLLKDTAPLSLTLLFNLLYFRIDSIILTLSRSTTEVGSYNLSYKIFEFFLVIPVFFMNSLYPILLKSKNNSNKFSSIFIRSLILLSMSGVFLTIVVWVLSPLLLILNKDFAYSVFLLRLLTLSFPVFFVSNLTMWSLITKREHKKLTIVYGSAMVLNILANVIFIPFYGATASALITLLGELYVLFVSVYFLKKHSF